MDYTNINGVQPTPQPEPEKPSIAPVVSGSDIVVKKPSAGQKLYSVLFSATPAEVATDLRQKVIIPAIRKGILDAITIGAAMLINGRGNNGAWPIGGYGGYYGGYPSSTLIDYNAISTNRVVTNSPTVFTASQPQGRPLGIFSLNTIEFLDIAKAELVKTKMLQHLAMYKVVSVSDYYDFCQVDHDWQAKNWGWDNLNGLEVVARGSRWILTLPQIRPIKEM